MIIELLKKIVKDDIVKNNVSQHQVYFRKAGSATWALFGPKGNLIYGPIMADKDFALKAAKAFASSWYNWVVIDEGGVDD